ncbi:hypothetical protein NOR_05224 [Metarhizium rileyi]|uniref:DEUBAD domain-containing protein n=1 Tax=Metarhizium rileyi (strain RCEF 4871) TaxID=1649241 RepID=A0A167CY41_METRR|nr:hypothetical protein NOR_05224 [Metarhizium rileyi RCEF 4871]TWU73445.1 hypothetical protein ED733_004634 [Metarhizium rileyi]
MPRRKRAAPKRQSKWNSDNILTDPQSPLASADLRSVLSNPLAWTSLSVEERKEVLSLFPDMAHTLDADTDDARPNFETLMNDDSFRYDCAAYVDHLARGRHDPVWLEDAWRAHDRRKAGEFEEWLGDKFVEDWGVEIPDASKVKPKDEGKTDGKADESSEAAITQQLNGFTASTPTPREGGLVQNEADNDDTIYVVA